ncbi:MAG TPA: BrnA antitoxin family protein [Anaerolineae bacterium]|jgi:uncharacterized protein (DUF4415 family)
MKNLPLYDWNSSDALDDDDNEAMDKPVLQQSFFENDMSRQPLPRLMVTLSVERDVIAWFRTQGSGWEKHMSAVLRAYVEARRKYDKPD